jgi:hypothetical protein
MDSSTIEPRDETAEQSGHEQVLGVLAERENGASMIEVVATTNLNTSQVQRILSDLAIKRRIVVRGQGPQRYHLNDAVTSAAAAPAPAAAAPAPQPATGERTTSRAEASDPFSSFGDVEFGGTASIAAGVAVFIVCWIIQAAAGGSSMFSMSYAGGGFFQTLLVTVTFWPGWLATLALIGKGVMDLIDN